MAGWNRIYQNTETKVTLIPLQTCKLTQNMIFGNAVSVSLICGDAMVYMYIICTSYVHTTSASQCHEISFFPAKHEESNDPGYTYNSSVNPNTNKNQKAPSHSYAMDQQRHRGRTSESNHIMFSGTIILHKSSSNDVVFCISWIDNERKLKGTAFFVNSFPVDSLTVFSSKWYT